MKFLSTFGQLPGTWLNLTLMIVSGLAEGLGLALFVPMIQLMSGEDIASLHQLFAMIASVFGWLGLEMKPVVLLVTITLLVGVSLVLGYLQRRQLAYAKHRVSHDLRDRFVSALLGSRWEHASQQAHGEVVNHIVTECARAGTALGYELMAVATALLIGVYIAFSVAISWELMIVVVVFGGITWMMLRPLTHSASGLGDAANEANRTLALYSVDYLRSLKLVKATSNEETVAAKLRTRSESVFDVTFRSENNLAQVYFLTQGLAALLLVLITGLGYAVLDTPPAHTLILLMFLIRIAPRIAQFQQQYQSYLLAGPAWRFVNEAISACEERSEDPNADGTTMQSLSREVRLDDVGYRYPESDSVTLSDLSLTIERNRMTAIVGPSGAGKSTLLDMIAGLRLPTTGRVLVDGEDLRNINLASYRGHIGLVSQETVIFNDTLRNNLLFFRPDAPQHVLDHAIAVAHLGDLVTSLPEGLDTLLGEGGNRFSGGQRQRVALARALVIEPELLLLDEATSALDNESERAIQKAIEEIAKSTTIVVIAHRLPTVRVADVIHVMEGGRVAETGTYDELLAQGGLFAALHESQFA